MWKISLRHGVNVFDCVAFRGKVRAELVRICERAVWYSPNIVLKFLCGGIGEIYVSSQGGQQVYQPEFKPRTSVIHIDSAVHTTACLVTEDLGKLQVAWLVKVLQYL